MPEQHTAKGPRQNLYLLFDDWHSGYTLNKVGLSPGSSKGEGDEKPLSPGSDEGEGAEQPLSPGSGEGTEQTLSSGVIMRICAPRGYARWFASAFGPKILVLHTGASDIKGVPIFDVQERSLLFGPAPNYPACPIYLPVGNDTLFALDIAAFDLCLWTPQRHTTWVWREERRGTWFWHKLTYPPFQRSEVSSYAVRPDGDILVSTKSSGATVSTSIIHSAPAGMATFIFDTKEYVWKRYGDWVLPFTGCGHYDHSMEAFVGISEDPETLGHLYSCTMDTNGTNSNTGNGLSPCPELKCTKETMYSKNPDERHVSATLVHMCQGDFCLVECVSIDDIRADQELREPGADQEHWERELGVDEEHWDSEPEADQEHWDREPGVDQEHLDRELGSGQEHLDPWDEEGVPQCGRFMYRLKTFSLRYDVNGDLELKNCRACCYSPPHETTTDFILQDPAAFWL